MKRKFYSNSSKIYIPIVAVFLTIAMLFSQPQTAAAAQVSSSCTDEITLVFSGLNASETVDISISYSTGQTEVLTQTADGSGDLTVTLDRTSNEVFSVKAQAELSDSIISTSVSCPKLDSNSGSGGDSNAFVCEPAFYQVLGSSLNKLDAQTFDYTILGTHNRGYNGIGYNVEDNYIYGIERINGKYHLKKIDNKGVHTDLGTVDIAGRTNYRGDFDLDGNLVVTNGKALYLIDVSATPPTVEVKALTKVGTVSYAFHDITFNRVTNTFWTYTRGEVIEIDPTALTIEKIADYTAIADGAPYGAAFSDADGDLYFSKNKTGVIYFADLNANGEVLDFYPIADGGASNNNDGASCPLAAPPFEMSCGDGIDNDLDGLIDDNDPDCMDTDSDGIVDLRDQDDDNDGIPDIVEEATAVNGGDSDNDGIPDSKDLDSDDDGMKDIEEAGHGEVDGNNDGQVDGDVGENGLADSVETSADSGVINYTVTNSDSSTPPDFQVILDSDSDGIPDIADLDDDNDGIPDSHECTYNVNSLPIAVINGSFEEPDIDYAQAMISQQWWSPPRAAVTFYQSDVNGWSTTAPDGRIELWQSGHGWVESFNGTQHAEINANGFGALYQDISTTPDSTMIWSFAHRGRGGPDTIKLNIGPADGTLVTVQTMTTDRHDWIVYSGEYVVPAGQTETRFEYQAVSTAYNNISVGNFLDNIQFYVQSESLNCNLDTDNDGIIDSLDLDSDGDGLSDAYESGHDNLNTDSEGQLTGDVGDNGLVDEVESEADSGVIGYSLRDTDENGTPNFQQFDDIDGDGVLEDDLDFDNDGILNTIECGSMPCTDDEDGDGIPNAFDLDSDNDGVNDLYEIRTGTSDVSGWLAWLDPDQNGVIDGAVGANGYSNALETDDTQDASYNPSVQAEPKDDDEDGKFNFLDVDRDGNGKSDIEEAGLTKLDLDNDGRIDDITDHDFDGIPTVSDGQPQTFGDAVPTGLTVALVSNAAMVSAGNTVELTMMVSNVGGANASNVDVEASLPDNISATTTSWNIPSIAANSTHTITWTANIVSTEANQAYEILVGATGQDSDGNMIPSDNSTLVSADIDPDDKASASVMGLGDTVCETAIKNVAFEDLKNEGWSDWDYNDLIVKLESEMCFTPSGAGTAVASDIWYDTLAVADTSNSCSDVEIEAETGNMFGFVAVNDSSASGGSYVQMDNIGIGDYVSVSSSRMITYSVNIPATGTYEVFGDVKGVDGKSDSFWFQINNEKPVPWHIPSKAGFTVDYVTDFVNGKDNISLELNAGEHLVTIYNREDGSRLDKLTFDCIEAAETPDSALASTTITYTLLARGAGFDHALMHNLPFAEGGQYSLTTYDGDGFELSSTSGVFNEGQPIEIFESSMVGLPPYHMEQHRSQTNTRADQEVMVNGYKAVLTFSVNNPEKYIQGDLTGFPWDLYLPVHNTDQEIHLQIPGHMENSQFVNTEFDSDSPLVGYNLPFGFVFEEEWTWPLEFEGIWKAYPEFVDFIGTGKAQKQNWYASENAFGPFLWNNRTGRQPLLPLTSEEITSRYFASPVVADIDEDGTPEIIIGDLIGNKVSVFDLDQNLVWEADTDGGVRAEVIVKDIDFDGDVELVVGDESGKLNAWHHDGSVVTNFPITVSDARLLSSPSIEDINDDAELDIIQVSSDGNMYVYNTDGSIQWQVALTSNVDSYGAQTRNGQAVIEDLDGDGSVEIIAPSADGAIMVFDSEGEMIWSYGAEDSITATPVVANFDPDQPGYEVIFGSGDSYLYVLNQNGELIWRRATDWIISSSPLLHDLDSDGFPEILIGGEDNKLHAFHYWADAVEGWPQEINGAITSAPVVGDIDADGEDEILIGGEDGKLYAWDPDGTEIPSWPKQTGESYKGSPVIMNADGDAEEEIFAADFSGQLLTWGITADDPIISARNIYLPFIGR